MENYSQVISKFVSETEAIDIPENVRERCRESLMNGTAAGLSAAKAEPTEILLGVLKKRGATGVSRLFGRSERLDLLNAVMVNAYMAHLNDYDDTYAGITYHTNPSNVPAVLGLGAELHSSGTDVVNALALGFEASIRVGLGLGRIHYDVGWHTTGTLGTIGTAFTCSRLLGLDAVQTNHALGLALTQAAGLRGLMFGSMAKGFNASKAAYNGLLAALLAEDSFTAAPNAIEAGRGFAAAASRRAGTVAYLDDVAKEVTSDRGVDFSRITEGLGSKWETLDIGFKPYASGAATHATIDALLQLRREIGLDHASSSEQVSKALRGITVLQITVPAHSMSLPRGREIETPLEAKFSLYNVAAIVLVRGKAGPQEYNEEALHDPDIEFVRRLVELIGDEQVEAGAGSLHAVVDGGREIDIVIDHALGTKFKPLDVDALERKLFDAADGVLTRDSIVSLAQSFRGIDQVSDVSNILELASV